MSTAGSVLFFAAESEPRNDNLIRLSAGFERKNWRVAHAEHDSLHISLNQWRLKANDSRGEEISLGEFDRIWLLGFGPRASFLDRLQLLSTSESEAAATRVHDNDAYTFVNEPEAYLLYQSKPALALGGFAHLQPPTAVARDLDELRGVLDQGEHWILKPTAGSFGHGVFRIHRKNTSRNSLLEMLAETGYVAVQTAVPNEHEKRWLICYGKPLAAYGRKHRDHRGNRASGAAAEVVAPDDAEWALAKEVGELLLRRGIRFAAVDIAHPYLLDVNFVNPGFLATYETLTGVDLTADVVEALS